MNVCILGASNSGKTYLAKAIGLSACSRYRVEYFCTEELVDSLMLLKRTDKVLSSVRRECHTTGKHRYWMMKWLLMRL